MHLAKYLQKTRVLHFKTITDIVNLAIEKELPFSRASIYRWERGTRLPLPSSIAQLNLLYGGDLGTMMESYLDDLRERICRDEENLHGKLD